MPTAQETLHAVHAALEQEKRINVHRHPIRAAVVEGAVVIEGEVPTIAAKKLALRLAGSVPGVRGVVDRLHVTPGERKGDGAIRDALAARLLQQPEMRDCRICVESKGRLEAVRDGTPAIGDIRFSVEEGIVTFEGQVPSLTHKRVAGVLAWWTPGCRDVINALDVVPAEEDNDAEIVDALQLVLEMDPLVDAAQLVATCRYGAVTLRGYVRTAEEARQAESDAWAIFAVDQVANAIEVRR